TCVLHQVGGRGHVGGLFHRRQRWPHYVRDGGRSWRCLKGLLCKGVCHDVLPRDSIVLFKEAALMQSPTPCRAPTASRIWTAPVPPPRKPPGSGEAGDHSVMGFPNGTRLASARRSTATAPAGAPSGPASRPSVIASGRTSPPGVVASTRAGWPPCPRRPLLMAARKQAA